MQYMIYPTTAMRSCQSLLASILVAYSDTSKMVLISDTHGESTDRQKQSRDYSIHLVRYCRTRPFVYDGDS
jgi:hypothetical protein